MALIFFRVSGRRVSWMFDIVPTCRLGSDTDKHFKFTCLICKIAESLQKNSVTSTPAKTDSSKKLSHPGDQVSCWLGLYT